MDSWNFDDVPRWAAVLVRKARRVMGAAKAPGEDWRLLWGLVREVLRQKFPEALEAVLGAIREKASEDAVA